MAAKKPLQINTVLAVLLVFISGEFLGFLVVKQFSIQPLLVTGITRLVQIMALVWLILLFEHRLAAIGWSPGTWRTGLWQGALWSMGFGLVAAIAMVAAYGAGLNPATFFRADLSAYHLPTFLVVGGLVAPVFEEICFRGVIYTFMRQVGLRIITTAGRRFMAGKENPRLESRTAVAFAVVCSTAIFAMLHFIGGLPVTQIVGGIVFALAYEISGNLMVPITIHATGNLAIFGLALL